ncbi:MAG: Re/Si-specific NAD(P)(+) transhydrogenase subunit alpha [Bacillota bacterium]|nr:Re/Si-specific NAD(P)(+) transhydrogenase subunit alpha [Bacillota bacterium]
MKDIFVCRETNEKETRVALVPQDAKKLISLGFSVTCESGAGLQAGYRDEEYVSAGAQISSDSESAKQADIVVRVQKPDSIANIKKGALHLSFLDPFNNREDLNRFAEAGIKAVSLEMIPRTSLAQKMDVQSSQASLAGYYSMILAAQKYDRIFPMMMTPSGTIQPAKVFIIGAGVAGLQAIATAKRMGARVQAFDTRPVVEDQVKSLGAKFVKIDLGDTGQTEGGYAKELTPEQVKKQQELQAKVCEQSDIIVTTAKVFGRKAPLLITKDVIERMKPGSIVIDMAVATGGNVEGSDPNRDVISENGVHIVGGDQLERQIPKDASNMFSSNITAFLTHFWDAEAKDLNLDLKDEILSGCQLTNDGAVIHPSFAQK